MSCIIPLMAMLSLNEKDSKLFFRKFLVPAEEIAESLLNSVDPVNAITVIVSNPPALIHKTHFSFLVISGDNGSTSNFFTPGAANKSSANIRNNRICEG